MARVILGYVHGKPIWSENVPAHAKLVSRGGLPLSQALTNITMVKGPKPKTEPGPHRMHGHPVCGAPLQANQYAESGDFCARYPGHGPGNHGAGHRSSASMAHAALWRRRK